MGLESFLAVKRRFEELGKYRGADLICDYAHHPKEILSTVQTAYGVTKNHLYVVFQPHTYSRTKSLMEEFVEVLKRIDRLMIYKTYPARERYDEAGDGKTLAKNVGSCLYADHPSALRAWLDCTVAEGDTVLFLGAGDIYYLAKFLTQKIDGVRKLFEW
jgi:UDP-N-acetylmuramate--alanine ligase